MKHLIVGFIIFWNIAGFHVYRSTSGSQGPFTRIASLPPTAERFEDPESIPGACYRLTIFDSSGREGLPGWVHCNP